MKLKSLIQLLDASDYIARHPPEIEVSVEEARELAKFCIDNGIGIIQEIVKHEKLSKDCFASDNYSKTSDMFHKANDDYIESLASKNPELAEKWKQIQEKLDGNKAAACEKTLGGGELERIAISRLEGADDITRFVGLTVLIDDINLKNPAASLAYAHRGIVRQKSCSGSYWHVKRCKINASKDLMMALVLDPTSELAAGQFCSFHGILTPDERAKNDASVKELKPITTPEEYENCRARFAWSALEVQSIKQTIENYYTYPLEPGDNAKDAEAVHNLLKYSMIEMKDSLYLLSRCKKQDFDYNNFFKGIEKIVKSKGGKSVSFTLGDIIELKLLEDSGVSYFDNKDNLSKAHAWCGFDELRDGQYAAALKSFERALAYNKNNADVINYLKKGISAE